MAIGDLAAAAGLTVYPSTQDKRLGYQNDNQRGDDIAKVMTDYLKKDLSNIGGTVPINKGGTGATTVAAARNALGLGNTSGALPVANGGTGSTTAATARTALGIPEIAPPNAAQPSKLPIYNSDSQLTTSTPTLLGHAASKGYVDGVRTALQPTLDGLYTGGLSPTIYSRIVGGNSVYISSAGQLGYLPSTRRLKKNIKDANLDPAAIRAVLVRVYQYKVATGLGDDTHIGVIAEELEAAGLSWLVGYDAAGEPMTVHYDQIGLLALTLAQHAEDRLDALEARLAKLEGKLTCRSSREPAAASPATSATKVCPAHTWPSTSASTSATAT